MRMAAQRADMQRDIEAETWIVPVEDLGNEGQMSRTANRKKFG